MIVVGAGRSGKTSFIRAVRNQPFEDTPSTAGVATATLETTALHEWKELEGSHLEKVTRLFMAG